MFLEVLRDTAEGYCMDTPPYDQDEELWDFWETNKSSITWLCNTMHRTRTVSSNQEQIKNKCT